MGSTLILAGAFSFSNWPYIAMAVLGLGIVIFVHELGHFVVAKLCGVKCEKFYIGFDVPIKLGWGKFAIQLPSALWKKQWGETEYGIGTIPLGGYVKMLGQDDNPGRQAELAREAGGDSEDAEVKPEPLDPRSYMAQTVPERMAIISAGVIMNILFAIIFAAIAFGMGVPYTACEVAFVSPNEPAWLANVRPGDRFLEINGVKNPRFKDFMQEVVLGNLDSGISAVVEHVGPDGTTTQRELVLKPHKEKIAKRKRAIIGVGMDSTLKLRPEKVATPNSPADLVSSQLHGGDTLVAIDGQPVGSYVDYAKVLSSKTDQPIQVTLERKKAEANADAPTERIEIEIDVHRMRRYGLVMKMSPVIAIQPESPAAKAGIQVGDRLVAIDGQSVGDPIDLPERLRRREGETVSIEVERGSEGEAKMKTLSATLRDANWPARLGETLEVPSLGIAYTVLPVVVSVKPDSPAAKAKIEPGDTITQVQMIPANDDQEAKEAEWFKELKAIPIGSNDGLDWSEWLSAVQHTQSDTATQMTIDRDGKTMTLDLVPVVDDNSLLAGRGFVFVGATDVMEAKSFGDALSLGWRETKYQMLGVYRFLSKLVSGGIAPTLMSGPVSIVAFAGMSAKAGWAPFLLFFTMLSANLAVINFLPIPVLDGGHMVFLTLEGIFRRPVSEKIVIPLTYAGLFLILGLMVFVLYLDAGRWVF